jgi:hypothetical protein
MFFFVEKLFGFIYASLNCHAEETIRQVFKLLTVMTKIWRYSTIENLGYLVDRVC